MESIKDYFIQSVEKNNQQQKVQISASKWQILKIRILFSVINDHHILTQFILPLDLKKAKSKENMKKRTLEDKQDL